MNHLEVNALQTIADLGIHVSMYESFGVVITELLWKGKPVIASTAGGIPEQYPDGLKKKYLINIRQEYKEKLLKIYEEGAKGKYAVDGILGKKNDPARKLSKKMLRFFNLSSQVLLSIRHF